MGAILEYDLYPEEVVIESGCIDVPDERDYTYPESAGTTSFPEEYIIDDLEDYQNQGLEEITKYMCVFYSTTHGCNILNNLENVGEADLSGKELGLKALDLGRLNVKVGAAIQDGPRTARDINNIEGWFLVNETTLKQALLDGHPVVVGSNSLNWSKTILESKASSGHAILIIGRNKEGYIIKESYGKQARDGGRQYLPYSLFGNLYPSKYALIDKENPLITNYKKTIMDNINIEKAKEAFTLGIWNGKDATKPASREEVSVMVLRGLEKLKNGEI